LDEERLNRGCPHSESESGWFCRECVRAAEQAAREEHEKDKADFADVYREVSLVYDSITMGEISKPNTKACHVIQAVEELCRKDADEARDKRDEEWEKKVRAIHRANITGFKSARADARRKALEEAGLLVMNIHDSGVENRAKRDLCRRIARKLSALAHEGVS
jgi:hypothetical protein